MGENLRGSIGIALILLLAIIALSASRVLHAQGQDSEAPSKNNDVSGWRTYTNKAYGFSVKYPKPVVILRRTNDSSQSNPPIVHRVYFQYRTIASGPMADLEPPQFAVDVFERKGARSLREWAETSGLIESGDTIEPFDLEGVKGGIRVSSMKMVAPNEFYYFATERYVFRLTALGLDGPKMLATFKLSTTSYTKLQ